MTARAFTRRDPAELKMKHRHVYGTDHPDVFRVIASNGRDEYRVVLLRAPIPKALCSCERGRRELSCWHARLVLKRRSK